MTTSESDKGELLPPPPKLTQEQLDRMALEELWEFNPNLADSAKKAAAHGFVWKHGPMGS